jgi:hypothetical protein
LRVILKQPSTQPGVQPSPDRRTQRSQIPGSYTNPNAEMVDFSSDTAEGTSKSSGTVRPNADGSRDERSGVGVGNAGVSGVRRMYRLYMLSG